MKPITKPIGNLEPKAKTKLFLCRVDAELLKKIVEFKRANRFRWSEIVEHCFRELLERAKKI